MPRTYKPTGNPTGRPKGSKNKVTKAKETEKAHRTQALTAEQAEFGVFHKKKGQSNSKNVQRLKDRLSEMLCSDEEIQALFDDLHAIPDPKDRCAMRRDLYQYVIPKVTAVDMNASMEVESIGDELAKLTHTTVMEGALGLGEGESEVEESAEPAPAEEENPVFS